MSYVVIEKDFWEERWIEASEVYLELGWGTAIDFMDLLSGFEVLVDDMYCLSRSDFGGPGAIFLFPGLGRREPPIFGLYTACA